MKVLIVGAGLGGLTAAACLMKRGHEVVVLEQSPELGEVGAGIQLSANAVKVVDSLGLRDELDRAGVRPLAYEFRRFDTGEMLHRVPLNEDDTHERLHGTPYYHVHRRDLHRILADAVQGLDPGCIRLSARTVGFAETASGVSVVLEDGREFAGDVLVGADGIKSVIRRSIVGSDRPVYTGQAAWRVVVPAERLPAEVMRPVVTVWCGPRNHAVVYLLRAGTLLNFVGCHEREWEEESWTARRPWGELQQDYAGWHPEVQAIIAATERDQCFRWALNSRELRERWSTARATLLGDAIHPTLPYMAQGAVMAIEDAAVLARCLDGGEAIADALRRYERNRAPRTTRIVRESAEHGELFHITDAAEMRAAFIRKDIARSRREWLYCYEPLTVELP
ncbi:MAG: FAD-dependent monooxygenase [Steroidobacteraceae bacterium]|jgi:salicylate hydroxylase|nr:FAD-dependent monooxygenase [Steroidobacteraceae bacterium]